jgi:hypothetical protein
MSDAQWFRHDLDAADGRRFTMLRLKGGYEAHGIYWALMKYLYKSSNCYPFATADDKQVLASCLHLDVLTLEKHIKYFIECNLLEINDENLVSEIVKDELFEQNNLRKKRIKAGSKGGKQKASNAIAKLKQNVAQTIQTDSTLHNKTIHTKKSALSSADFIFPDQLNNFECRKILDDWIEHRKELKKLPTSQAIEKTLKKYSERPIDFIKNIENSIANGYQGIFPESTSNGTTKRTNFERNIEVLKEAMRDE